ncbi:MAG: phasin family protein [Gammaproteobacteria bacterium]|nr:phasin family protein [Gammaproteobacteria bacterium]
MNDNQFFAQSEKYLAPAIELNKLAIKNTEKLVKMQIANMQSYSKLGMDSWKAALEVKDADSFQAYAEKQREVMQDTAKKLTEDAKEVAELGNVYSNEARKIFQDSVKEASTKAA